MSQASNAVKRTQRARNWKRIKDARFLYLMLLLPVVYFVVFKYGAITWLVIAFKKYNAFKGIAGTSGSVSAISRSSCRSVLLENPLEHDLPQPADAGFLVPDPDPCWR
jgi:hypothetical protein